MLESQLNVWKRKNLNKMQDAVLDIVENLGMRVENSSMLEMLSEKWTAPL